MIKIAVCDDNELICKSIEYIITEHKFNENVQVDAFITGEELYENAVIKRYDIICMDIELEPEVPGGETGMDISNKIKEVYPDVLMIFISGRLHYRNQLLEFEPFRFIRKPFNDTDVIFAIEKAIKRIRGWEEKYFTYSKNKIYFRKNLKEIIYFSSSYPYIELQSLYEKISFRGKIDAIEEKISKLSDDFLRPNKSFLVNRKFIDGYSVQEVIMKTGERITISRKYNKEFMERMKI